MHAATTGLPGSSAVFTCWRLHRRLKRLPTICASNIPDSFVRAIAHAFTPAPRFIIRFRSKSSAWEMSWKSCNSVWTRKVRQAKRQCCTGRPQESCFLPQNQKLFHSNWPHNCHELWVLKTHLLEFSSGANGNIQSDHWYIPLFSIVWFALYRAIS